MAYEVKGVVARSKGAPVTVETVVVPDPGPGEAVVDVQACGVCATDLHYREGNINDEFPFLLGHEAAGVVSAVGDGVTIVAVDVEDRKLEWARKFGATHTVNSRETDPVEAIKGLTGGFGVDVAIDAVGHPKVFEQAFYARDLAGRVVMVGVPTPGMTIELPAIEVFGRGGAVKASSYGDCLPSRDFPMLVDLYRQGRFPLEDFVSETVGIDDVDAAFDKMRAGEVLRSVVVFQK